MHAPATARESFPERAIEDCRYRLSRDYGGSVSAEHGIGTYKRDYLALCRDPEEIVLMRGLKRALDPKGIVDSGRIPPD